MKENRIQTTENRIFSTKTNVTRISRHCHHSLNQKKRSNNIIHIQIRTPKVVKPIHDNFIDHHSNKSLILTTIENHYPEPSERELSNNQNSTKSLNNLNRSRQNTFKNVLFLYIQSISEDESEDNAEIERTGSLSNKSIESKYIENSQQHNNSSITDINHQHYVQDKLSKLSKKIERSSDQKGIIEDYHQDSKKNKKKKCPTRRCIIVCVLVTLIPIVILAIVLPILLIKSTTTKDTPLLRWNTTGITIAGISGVAGNSSEHLNNPFDAKIDYSNTLYIADRSNHRIQKYLKNASIDITVAGQANATAGSSSYDLRIPSAIFVESNGDIFISDTANNRVQYWANGASSGLTIAGNSTGVAGNGSDQLSNPYNLARDLSTGTLYVADYNNHRVMSYTSGASSGTVAAGGNGFGLNQTQIGRPAGLYLNSLSNSLIISSRYGCNVVRWILGANSWTLLAGSINGLQGNTSTLFASPMSVTLDPMGNIYVADYPNHRIQFFLADQSNGSTIAGISGISGSNSSILNAPMSIGLDNQLNLYVTDYANHRIQK